MTDPVRATPPWLKVMHQGATVNPTATCAPSALPGCTAEEGSGSSAPYWWKFSRCPTQLAQMDLVIHTGSLPSLGDSKGGWWGAQITCQPATRMTAKHTVQEPPTWQHCWWSPPAKGWPSLDTYWPRAGAAFWHEAQQRRIRVLQRKRMAELLPGATATTFEYLDKHEEARSSVSIPLFLTLWASSSPFKPLFHKLLPAQRITSSWKQSSPQDRKSTC